MKNLKTFSLMALLTIGSVACEDNAVTPVKPLSDESANVSLTKADDAGSKIYVGDMEFSSIAELDEHMAKQDILIANRPKSESSVQLEDRYVLADDMEQLGVSYLGGYSFDPSNTTPSSPTKKKTISATEALDNSLWDNTNTYKIRAVGHANAVYYRSDTYLTSANTLISRKFPLTTPLKFRQKILSESSTSAQAQNPNNPNGSQIHYNFNSTATRLRDIIGAGSGGLEIYNQVTSIKTAKSKTNSHELNVGFTFSWSYNTGGADIAPKSTYSAEMNLGYTYTRTVTTGKEVSYTTTQKMYMPDLLMQPGETCEFKYYERPTVRTYTYTAEVEILGDIAYRRKRSSKNYEDIVLTGQGWRLFSEANPDYENGGKSTETFKVEYSDIARFVGYNCDGATGSWGWYN